MCGFQRFCGTLQEVNIPGHISRQNFNPKDACSPMFIATLLTTAKTGKQPIHKDKEDGTYMQWNTAQP